MLIVEQKARQSLAFSDYAYVLEMGRNRFQGTGQELLADPAVVDLYLGAGRSFGRANGSRTMPTSPIRGLRVPVTAGVERGER